MRIDTAIEYADQLLYERTGRHLSDLQSRIIQQSCQGQTYGQVASAAGYSEGHIKDVASQLWKLLSEALGERITKGNLRSRLINRVKRTVKNAAPNAYESIAVVARPAFPQYSSQFIAADPLAAPPLTFIGRTQALQKLQTLAQAHRIIVIQGEGGIGKTTLAQRYARQFDQMLELPMAKESANITPAQSVVEEWLRRHFDDEPGGAFGVTLSRLKRHLDEGTTGQNRIGVLIDNLEPALNGNGQFIAEHRHYVELLRMLASAKASVVITSRDRLCEPGIKIYHYRLPGLAVNAWQQFFTAHTFAAHNEIDSTAADILAKMHRAYGGNAKAMEILCAAAAEDFEGDLSAYWQENSADLLGATDLRNLVVSQVNRLQQLDANAYKVFCRLGCYRYQDQPRLKAAAITALMWDIDPAQHKQTLNSLRDRSLLEFRKGDYWLHPVSRAEAIARLRQGADKGTDWQQSNQAAAEYWRNQVHQITSVKDGLQALEAYYHLIAAEDCNGAAAVLLQSRHNQWRQFLPLASSLYRMGLLQPVISAITQVLPKVEQGRGELNNILGDVYWITGRIHSAIACQEQTLRDANKQQNTCLAKLEQLSTKKDSEDFKPAEQRLEKEAYYFKMLIVDAHLSIGLYCIDLWELTQAARQFEEVIALADRTAHQAWADKATVGLALVRSYLGDRSAAELASSLYGQFTAGPADQHGRSAYFLQLLGQTFDSLGELDKAQVLYERAIEFAEAGHYVQVKAKALTGLAVLQRQQNCEVALQLHAEAIALCETIGAQCDLAEAYFQCGQSMQTAVEQPVAIPAEMLAQADYFERAIALFSEIRAPQQVARVSAHQNCAPKLRTKTQNCAQKLGQV